MSQTQLKRAHVLRSYNEGTFSRREAAEKLSLSERQVQRLAKGMREEGEQALIHKNSGRKPAIALSDKTKEAIVMLRRQEVFAKCNVMHFREILGRDHGIAVSYSALYGLLKAAGIESPKKHRKTKPHRRRKRKARPGELCQIDASPFDWFGDGNQSSMHGSIDDATGEVTGLFLTENECRQGYFEVMEQTFRGFGVPLSLYSDKHTIFRSPLAGKKEAAGEEAAQTQFGRAMDELGINIIHARSPQAKGRIERLWGTLQSRVPVELKLRGITGIDCANKYLAETFIPEYNRLKAVKAEGAPVYVPLRPDVRLDEILCVKDERRMDAAGVFSYKGKCFRVLDEGYPLVPARARVTVLAGFRSGLKVSYKGRSFGTAMIDKPARKAAQPARPRKPKREPAKLRLAHSSDEWKKVWHFESLEDTLDFLYDVFFVNAA